MGDEQPRPDSGEQAGPCAICGSYALPKFGEFLCPSHATRRHAKRAKAERDE